MSSLKRIFTVIDDEPSITPIGINIPCFTKLYKEDKSPTKESYGKWLGYIYHMSAVASPYHDAKNKAAVVAKSFMGNEDYKPSQLVLDCIKECIERENTPEARSLEAAITLADAISDSALSVKQENDQLQKLLKEIDFELKKTLGIDEKIKLMTAKQTLEAKAIEKAQKASTLVSSMQKSIDELSKLRKTVAMSMAELEQDNKDAVSNFMIDNLIDKYV